jgi:hypothetical protein
MRAKSKRETGLTDPQPCRSPGPRCGQLHCSPGWKTRWRLWSRKRGVSERTSGAPRTNPAATPAASLQSDPKHPPAGPPAPHSPTRRRQRLRHRLRHRRGRRDRNRSPPRPGPAPDPAPCPAPRSSRLFPRRLAAALVSSLGFIFLRSFLAHA